MASQFPANAGITQTPLTVWQPGDPPGEEVNLTKEQPTTDKWDHWHLFNEDPDMFEDVPANVRLSDLVVAHVIANASTKERGEKWPGDFAKTGEIRRTRPNNGAPAVTNEGGSGRFLIAFGFYQLIGGLKWNHVRTFLGSKVINTKWNGVKHLSVGDFADDPPVTRSKKREIEEAPTQAAKKAKTRATKLSLRAPTPFYPENQKPTTKGNEATPPTNISWPPTNAPQRLIDIHGSPTSAQSQQAAQADNDSGSELTQPPPSPGEDRYTGSPLPTDPPAKTEHPTTEELPSRILARHHRRQSRVAEIWQEGLEDMAMDIAKLQSRGL
ncbi:MAG: hypothetical protein M1817_001098 [Caeruleum heppii]|nr:MAG: hypothetical protein M1817_001098 [Caeruleum heppii]